MLPWAVVFKDLGAYGFWSMLVFIVVLTVGFVTNGKRCAGMGIEGVLKKGFITTSADTVLNYMRTGSLWPVTFGLACCAVEMMHAGMARYDLDRFGIIFRPSPVRPT